MLRYVILCVVSTLIKEASPKGPAKEYIAYPRLLEERGRNGEKLLHIKDGLTLRLEKISSLGETFVFTERNGPQIFRRHINPKELQDGLFEDKRQLAAVSVKHTNKGVEIDGMLSPTLRISPLPFMARSEYGSIAHNVSEMKVHADYNHDYILQPESVLKGRALKNYYIRPTPKPVNIPAVFEIEMKLVVDQHHHRHFESFEELIKYLLLLITMMSHRYQEVTFPEVRFLLTEVEMDNGTFYSSTIYGTDPIQPNGKHKLFLNAETTMNKLVQTQGSSEADVVVLLTGMDITGVTNKGQNPNLAGRAYVGAVCAVTYKVGVVEDVATTYSGVSVLAHELGHALGMPHDGESPQWPDPGNTWTQCKASDEYLMAPIDGGRNNGYLSRCSIAAFRAFVKTLSAVCFFVKSKEKHSQIPQELPGITMNATTLCKRTYSTFKYVSSHITTQLQVRCKIQCCIQDLGYCYLKNMIDGMSCGVSKTCLRHRCANRGSSRGLLHKKLLRNRRQRRN
uniref:Putative metalloprotease n=1 Tax=Ixodes ricinus TaxID=34613 RepID=A0A0K8RJM7_IXORI